MNKYKYLLENIGILTIASLSTKIISYFLVPLYTGILSSSEYGTYDLINTTISLIVPILTLNIHEAITRFGLEKKYNQKDLLQVALKYFFIGLAILILFTFFIIKTKAFMFIYSYPVFFVLLYLTGAFTGIATSYARSIYRISDIAMSSVIAAITTIILNIIFLVKINLGLPGYLLAAILGAVTQCIYIVLKSKMWRQVTFSKTNKELEMHMLAYSVPLISNSIAWWINSASDRYMVSYLCGVDKNGIYAIAYKIPSLLTMFQTVFNQAWIMSAVMEFDEHDNSGFFSNTYNIYNTLMVISCSVLILLNKAIAYFLFKNEFYSAWMYAPFLLISVVFGAASGYMGGIFSTIKRTDIAAITVGIGAFINVCLNFIFINLIGTLGAAIATLFSYFAVWLIRYIAVKKKMTLMIHVKRDLLSYFLLLLQSFSYLLLKKQSILFSLEIILSLSIILLYSKELLLFKSKLRNIFNTKYGR